MAEIKTPKPFGHLTAISSLDGRFRGRVESLSVYFSEFATIKGRVLVEIEYLIKHAEIMDETAVSHNKVGVGTKFQARFGRSR